MTGGMKCKMIALIAVIGLSISQAFRVPRAILSPAATQPRMSRRRSPMQMMMIPGESQMTSIMIAASRFIKDVPSTLSDMSEAVGNAPYTLPDGSYTNAGEVAEEVVTRIEPSLPPPYYAVAFALFLLVVSGVQQLSLGNVFDEEAKSADTSGAVARRMNMRNRSFFKKK